MSARKRWATFKSRRRKAKSQRRQQKDGDGMRRPRRWNMYIRLRLGRRGGNKGKSFVWAVTDFEGAALEFYMSAQHHSWFHWHWCLQNKKAKKYLYITLYICHSFRVWPSDGLESEINRSAMKVTECWKERLCVRVSGLAHVCHQSLVSSFYRHRCPLFFPFLWHFLSHLIKSISQVRSSISPLLFCKRRRTMSSAKGELCRFIRGLVDPVSVFQKTAASIGGWRERCNYWNR